MREIKFRFWRKDTKQMFNDIQFADFQGETIVHEQFLNEGIEMAQKTFFEIMQFTGLLDKNGKEIWESDIIRCYSKGGEHIYDHEVKLPDFYREIWSSKIAGEDKMWFPADEGEICGGIEVIGNVFENPSLLNNKE